MIVPYLIWNVCFEKKEKKIDSIMPEGEKFWGCHTVIQIAESRLVIGFDI